MHNIFHEHQPYRPARRKAEDYDLMPQKRPRGRARILSEQDIERVETQILRDSKAPYAYLLKFRLTVYAGLRVGEVLNIHIDDLVDSDGKVSEYVTVRPKVGKGGKGRAIPMHPKIAHVVLKFLLHHPDMNYIAFSQRWRTPKRQTLTALTNQLWWFYKKAGLRGCSSHSGRRTFITNLAKIAPRIGMTLRDVQEAAGHARLDTTEVYIEPSGNLAKLIRSLK